MDFSVSDGRFLRDGKPWQVMSGAIHYFRIPRAYWHDRLLKLKECGLNTVETYTCWNLHEPKEGTFDFSGGLDVGAFIDEAASVGLDVIVRPGPYICAEWDNGGIPAWLLAEDGVAMRSRDPRYLDRALAYLDKLTDILFPRLAQNGGNVVMMQIENEYGSYGNDKVYLKAFCDFYRKRGVTCPLFTSDGPATWLVGGGSVEGAHCVVNFQSDPEVHFALLRDFRPEDPPMCGEYWCGWFDHWGDAHHTKSVESTVSDIRKILETGGSFNLYMFCGGTNFGFMNGANEVDGVLWADTTSYDYDAPLSEAGDRTPLYYALRDMIAAYTGKTTVPTAKESEKAAYGKVTMTEAVTLFYALDEISSSIEAAAPLPMEKVGQAYGYILYSTVLSGPFEPLRLRLDGMRDRAGIFLDGKLVGVYDDLHLMTDDELVTVPAHEKGETSTLSILVENMGRVNYGPTAFDRKGLCGARLEMQYQFGWLISPLPMDNLDRVPFRPLTKLPECPAFFRGTLTVEGEPKDTFVRLDGFKKGFVTVNGFNLGRYFNTSCPQKNLYVPASVLKTGENTVVVFESDGTASDTITFTDVPDVG